MDIDLKVERVFQNVQHTQCVKLDRKRSHAEAQRTRGALWRRAGRASGSSAQNHAKYCAVQTCCPVVLVSAPDGPSVVLVGLTLAGTCSAFCSQTRCLTTDALAWRTTLAQVQMMISRCKASNRALTHILHKWRQLPLVESIITPQKERGSCCHARLIERHKGDGLSGHGKRQAGGKMPAERCRCCRLCQQRRAAPTHTRT